MEATITSAKFIKEFESKFGMLYSHQIEYDGKKAYYSSKSKDQKKFIPGQKAEFTEEKRTGKKGEYLVIKPATQNYASPGGKAIQREQSKYSGFAVSYVKDLIVAGKVPIEDWKVLSGEMCEFMFNLDKNLLK